MNRRVARTVISLTAFMALTVGLVVKKIVSPPVMSAEQLSENGFFLYEYPRRFTDFSLADQHGEAFNLEDLQGHWTLVFFGFTHCPDICPTTMATLSRFDRLLDEGPFDDSTQVVMVSVDPQRDTPELLGQYMSFFGSDFRGVTGEYIEIFNLARNLNVAFGYLPGEDGNYDVTHSGEIALINPNGHFHGFFKSPHDAERMVRNYQSVRMGAKY